jgi:antitoxin component YwqK of YwqJK toxin-antitoxin module
MSSVSKMAWPILILLFFAYGENEIPMQQNVEKIYLKTYYKSGEIKAEGWMEENQKTDYWYNYFRNGKVESKGSFVRDKKSGYWYFYDQQSRLLREGHFRAENKENWWVFYDSPVILHKMQFENNRKNGFCFIYKNGVIAKADRYKNDTLKGSWRSIAAFKKDNPNASF